MKQCPSFKLVAALAVIVAGCSSGSSGSTGTNPTPDAGPTCTATQTLCGGACFDTQTNRDNCGACGTACAGGEVCVTGKCALSCPTGQVNCGGKCATTDTDVANCGACGKACPGGQVCSAGKCGLTCDPSQTNCMGVCRDTKTDPANCGGCGTACKGGEVCTASVCGATCGAGLTSCSGTCRDLKNDNSNCGACSTAGTTDKACASGSACVAGVCTVTCVTGETLCDVDGKCHDLTNDNNDCGACSTKGTTDKACPSGKVCSAGVCGVSCVAGTTLCSDGKCHDLTSDNGNCGACSTTGTTDKACPAGTSCTASVCTATCGAGLTACGVPAACTSLQYDPNNCGACGTVCGAGKACVAGSCASLTGGGAAKRLYLANWAGFNKNFNAYDFATSTWLAGIAALPIASRGQLATTLSTVRMYGTDNFVYEYTPGTNTWAKGIAGPTLSSFAFFQYLNGNMYLCQAGTTTLNIHNGIAWSTLTLPVTCSVAGGIDPATKEVYVKHYGDAGFMVVSATSSTLLRTITDATAIGENTSSAAYLGGTFYARSATGNIFALNGISGARTDTGMDPGGSYPGFVADPAAGAIYMLSASSFKSFKPSTGFTALTAGPSESTLATITYTN